MESQNMPLFYSSLAGDKDFAELLQEFVQELGLRQQALRDRLASGDHTELIRLIHQLRGSCGSYGFASLTHAAGEIDDQYRAGVPLERLESQVNKFIDALSFVTASPRP